MRTAPDAGRPGRTRPPALTPLHDTRALGCSGAPQRPAPATEALLPASLAVDERRGAQAASASSTPASYST